jgi:predicted RNA binding protein YcfA (HicA-like mRNA interferase family)
LPRLPVLSAKEVIKALDQLGFKVIRQYCSHIHLLTIDRNLLVTVPESCGARQGHADLDKGWVALGLGMGHPIPPIDGRTKDISAEPISIVE